MNTLKQQVNFRPELNYS